MLRSVSWRRWSPEMLAKPLPVAILDGLLFVGDKHTAPVGKHDQSVLNLTVCTPEPAAPVLRSAVAVVASVSRGQGPDGQLHHPSRNAMKLVFLSRMFILTADGSSLFSPTESCCVFRWER